MIILLRELNFKGSPIIWKFGRSAGNLIIHVMISENCKIKFPTQILASLSSHVYLHNEVII